MGGNGLRRSLWCLLLSVATVSSMGWRYVTAHPPLICRNVHVVGTQDASDHVFRLAEPPVLAALRGRTPPARRHRWPWPIPRREATAVGWQPRRAARVPLQP